MKRVLIFSLFYHPFVGGAEIAVKEITDRIPAEDIEFHLITLRTDSRLPKEETLGNVRVHRIGLSTNAPTAGDLARLPLAFNKHLYQLLAAGEAARLHRSFNFDGVWAIMAHSAGIPAGIFKRMHPSVPYLLTLQEGDPPEHVEHVMRPAWPLFVQGFRRADAVQAISTFLASWARRMDAEGEIRVIPNGVDTKRFARAYTQEEIEEARRALGKREGDLYLVTTSRLVHKNGIDDVIRALAFLPPEVSFIVYGVGADEAMLRELAEREGVADRVRFLGQIGHEDMPRILSACDIFVRPSRSEGMGNSFVEAMAAGLPVIATQEGGISDFLFDARRNPDVPATGWAVSANMPEEIAEAVKEIREHPERTSETVKRAKDLALSTYDWDLVARDMRELLLSLTS